MKKGQIAEAGFAIFMILLTTFGTVFILNEGSKAYVGDNRTFEAYEYSICQKEIEKIPQENIQVFSSRNAVKENNYTLRDCNG